MLSLLLLACQSAPTYYADVKPILDGRCVSCHVDGGIAPFALDRYDAAAASAPLLPGSVSTRKMPPFPAGRGEGEVPFAHDPSLTDDQIAAIVDWAEAGAPEGDPEREGDPIPKVGGTLSRSDVTLSMPEPYEPTTAPDDYRCFILDWDGTDPTWVTGFRVTPGNTRIVHHVAAYLIPPDTLMGEDVFTTLQSWDDAEPGPGYTCFGGPSGPEDLQIPVSQLAQWVPGSQGTDFPADTGILVKPGSKVVLQVHYHTLPGETDQTTFEVRTDPTVAHPAAFGPWLDALWPLGNMNIPAGERVTLTAEGDPRGLYKLVLGDDGPDLTNGFLIHSALLHQHTTGESARVTLLKASGDEIVLVDVPEYDFNWQLTYAFEAPVRFENGDALKLDCTYDNTAGATDLNWGEGTGDEMCVANLYVSQP
jgi:hypothetical protein